MTIPLNDNHAPDQTSQTTRETTRETTDDLGKENSQRIIALLQDAPEMTTRELAKQLGITVKGVEWHISNLKAAGLLTREGGRAHGKWIVLQPAEKAQSLGW